MNGKYLRMNFTILAVANATTMRNISNAWIIHGFAVLHAMTTTVCLGVGINDTIFLTLLTMTMTVIICVREKLSVEFTAISIILVNIIGYLIGMAAATLFQPVFTQPMMARVVSTFVTTELMGWSIALFIKIFGSGSKDSSRLSEAQLKWVLIAVGAILAARLLIVGLTRTTLFDGASVMEITGIFLSNPVPLLVMVFATILYVRARKKRAGLRPWFRLAVFAAFVLALCVVGTLMAGFGLPMKFDGPFTFRHFLELLIVSMIIEAAIYSIVYMIDSAQAARRSMVTERDRANLAKFEYLNLKRQVNPHFLFNSLNILDCLIANGKNDDARDFVRKLSRLYRYMLRNENEPLVSLNEEMEYVDMYVDLLKLRFGDGLIVEKDIREEDLNRYIVKYSVQMLIENANKHNSVSTSEPLKVSIRTDGEKVEVTNNKNPKLTETESTGLGLKYIRQNYLDRGGKDIVIDNNDEYYRVALPLL